MVGMARVIESQADALMAVHFKHPDLSAKEQAYIKAAVQYLTKGTTLMRRLGNHLGA
jgi:hypothetical protein